jgi:hypothetical protein
VSEAWPGLLRLNTAAPAAGRMSTRVSATRLREPEALMLTLKVRRAAWVRGLNCAGLAAMPSVQAFIAAAAPEGLGLAVGLAGWLEPKR